GDLLLRHRHDGYAHSHTVTADRLTHIQHDALPSFMEGDEFTENIINGVERPVKAPELFAFTLRVRPGNTDVLTDAEENLRQKLRAEGVKIGRAVQQECRDRSPLPPSASKPHARHDPSARTQ